MKADRLPISHDRVITMTELQKLSLRKLREMRLDSAPLVVHDARRRQRRFVILDHDAYERLIAPRGARPTSVARLEDIDYADRGLFWDRPDLTNRRFAAILGERADPEHGWAWSRILERLPSRLVTRAVGLEELTEAVARASLRPSIRRAWEGAIEFWTEEARRRRA